MTALRCKKLLEHSTAIFKENWNSAAREPAGEFAPPEQRHDAGPATAPASTPRTPPPDNERITFYNGAARTFYRLPAYQLHFAEAKLDAAPPAAMKYCKDRAPTRDNVARNAGLNIGSFMCVKIGSL